MELQEMSVDGGHIFIFPYFEGMVGVGEEFNLSKEGVQSCSDGDPNLGGFLNMIEHSGGKDFKPTTVITKEIVCCANFMNTQENMVSLHLYA